MAELLFGCEVLSFYRLDVPFSVTIPDHLARCGLRAFRWDSHQQEAFCSGLVKLSINTETPVLRFL